MDNFYMKVNFVLYGLIENEMGLSTHYVDSSESIFKGNIQLV